MAKSASASASAHVEVGVRVVVPYEVGDTPARRAPGTTSAPPRPCAGPGRAGSAPTAARRGANCSAVSPAHLSSSVCRCSRASPPAWCARRRRGAQGPGRSPVLARSCRHPRRCWPFRDRDRRAVGGTTRPGCPALTRAASVAPAPVRARTRTGQRPGGPGGWRPNRPAGARPARRSRPRPCRPVTRRRPRGVRCRGRRAGTGTSPAGPVPPPRGRHSCAQLVGEFVVGLLDRPGHHSRRSGRL